MGLFKIIRHIYLLTRRETLYAISTFRERWRYQRFRAQGVQLGKLVRIGPGVKLIGKISIGDHCMLVGNTHIQGHVEIGSHVVIAPNCTLLGANHDFDTGNALPYGTDYIVRKITIADNVWLGMHVKVLGGAHIEEGAVVGIGSVVTGRIPAGAVAVGAPARVIKYRDMERYNRLLKEQKFIFKLRRQYPGRLYNLLVNQTKFLDLIRTRGFVLDFEIQAADPEWQRASLYHLAVSHQVIFGNAGHSFAAIRPDILSSVDACSEAIAEVVRQNEPEGPVDAGLIRADVEELSRAVLDPDEILSSDSEYSSWFLPPLF